MTIDVLDKDSLNKSRGRMVEIHIVFRILKNWQGVSMGTDVYIKSFVHKEDAEKFAHECKVLHKHYDEFEVRPSLLKF